MDNSWAQPFDMKFTEQNCFNSFEKIHSTNISDTKFKFINNSRFLRDGKTFQKIRSVGWRSCQTDTLYHTEIVKTFSNDTISSERNLKSQSYEV